MTPLGAEDKAALLRLARQAVEAGVKRTPPPESGGVSVAVGERAGAFVTLTMDGELRGCVGYVEPPGSLAETVARAGAAVTRDRRFPPLRPSDLPRVEVEVSVLSPLSPIRAEAVEVGRHGLVISCQGLSGLLLPHVPEEYGWDRETFLEHLCRKAGLPPTAWRRPDAELQAFTSQRFAEEP